MKEIWKPTPNFWAYSDKKIAIIFHKGLGSLIGDLLWIRNPKSQVSYSHYFPRKGNTYYKLVKDDNSSWAAGHVTYEPTELGKKILQKDPTGKREYRNANLYVYNFGFQGKKNQTYTESQIALATRAAKELGVDLIIGTHHDLVPYKPKMDEYRIEVEKRLDGVTEHNRPDRESLIKKLRFKIAELTIQVLLLKIAKLKSRR